MIAYGVVLKPARVALILFALSVVLAFAGVTGLDSYHARKEQSIMQTEQKLAATHEDIKKLTSDLDTINRLSAKYEQLARLGFVGNPDRDAWVQQLKTIYRDTRLPPTLRYTLAPPQLINQPAVPADAPAAYRNNILHHDLVLELSGINDTEFLDFIDKLNTDWQVPYRVETCQIARDQEPVSGLQIKCTLQIYSLPGKQ